MSKVIDLDSYRPFRGRRIETLVRWWDGLNRWRWFSVFGPPEPRDAKAPRRRTRIMCLIEIEIGFRTCLAMLNKKRNRK